MALTRRLLAGVLALLVAVSLLSSSCEASFLDSLRQSILGAFPAIRVHNVAAAEVPLEVTEKPKREGKRVAVIGMCNFII